MMTDDTAYTGGCLCGAVRYRVDGTVDKLCYCHCESCRRGAGAPMVAWGCFAQQRFVVTRGRLAEYRSSATVLRGFCANCGTSITYRNDKRPGEIDVTLATLDDPTAVEPAAHIGMDDKLSWVGIDDGRPQFRRSLSGGV